MRVWWSLLSLLLCSCASITYSGRHQEILVQTDPPGAHVLIEGEDVGVTPTFVRLRRSREPHLELLTAREKQIVSIQTSYEWKNFFSNFIFLVYAPGGWLIDSLTGSDWDLHDTAIIKIQSDEKVPKPEKIAIAPPVAPTVTMSDSAAQIWQRQNLFRKLQVLDYEETLPVFNAHHFEFDDVPNKADRYGLYRELGVTKIFESKVIESKNGDIIIKGQYLDVFSKQTSDEQVVRIQESELKEMEVENWSRKQGWLHLIPNTFGIDFSTSQTEIDTNDGMKHLAQPASGASSLEKALYYVGAVDITRQNLPRKLGSSRFRFQITPSLFVINQRLSFPDFPEISSTIFHYAQISAGLGAEAGWQKGMHYLYFNLIPMYGFQYVAWTQGQGDRSLALGGFELRAEIGYRYYFNRHWSGRLFVKSTNSYTDLWDSVIHDIAPSARSVSNAIDTSAGYAVAYTFDLSPEFKYQLKER